MKVCTDSCILGAWFAQKNLPHKTILDIGAGTGLLMFMLAQKTGASIDGVELNTACFDQLVQNIQASGWKQRLKAYQGDIRSYPLPIQYEFIITNPPFFEKNLPSFSNEEKIAKHSSELSLIQLVEVIDRNLLANGSFGILLPFERWEYFRQIANARQFHLSEKLLVKHSPVHDFSRAILYFSREPQNTTTTIDMSIHRPGAQGYSDEFVELLKDYYLYL